MAPRKKPPIKKLKFELTRSAIAGVGVVCFCVFLWMFLLGVWAGQSLLIPLPYSQKNIARNVEDSNLPVLQAVSKKKMMDN